MRQCARLTPSQFRCTILPMAEPNPTLTEDEESILGNSRQAADARAARVFIWKKLGRWLALALLFVAAVAIGFGTGKLVKARREFGRGRSEGKVLGEYDRDLAAYQGEMSSAGLGYYYFPEGSGYYITLYNFQTLADSTFLPRVDLREFPHFLPCMKMVPHRYYQVHSDGTITYEDQ